uniref:Uncharacterized protein n=1 Tax=Trichuris muris TaxID=70415 RepID=A0A5S6R520_TRIMR
MDRAHPTNLKDEQLSKNPQDHLRTRLNGGNVCFMQNTARKQSCRNRKRISQLLTPAAGRKNSATLRHKVTADNAKGEPGGPLEGNVRRYFGGTLQAPIRTDRKGID